MEEDFLDKEIVRMLEMEAICETQETDLVLSSIYTVAKKGGFKRRPVINLRWVNSHLQTVKFKMATMKDVKTAITKDCYMTSIDLTDCFWGLPLHPREQRTTAFEWRGKRYKFTVLPFGLALSPLFITKLYRHMIEELQARGHSIIIYVDDMLIFGVTKSECEAATAATLSLLQELGAVVNRAKSSLSPIQHIEYLGFELDSVKMEITAPKKKLANMAKTLRSALNKPASARTLASILGKITSLADAMFPTRVHTTGLHQMQMHLLNSAGWDKVEQLSTEARQDLQWWKDNLHSMNGKSLVPATVDVRAATDASDYGWGAWIETPQGLVRWGGLFTADIAKHHINYKELLTVDYLLRSTPVDLRGKVLELGIDNTTAMWYLRKMGGCKPELARLAQEIHNTLSVHQITHLHVYHLPGVLNTIADEESRNNVIHLADFQLHPITFAILDNLLGPCTIDLFATFENRQMHRFASLSPQPEAIWVDALKHPWNAELGWANPPFALIGRTLQKVEFEQSTIVLLAPLWFGQPWFPALVRLMAVPPVLIPNRPHLFQHPLAPQGANPTWVTAAWLISGDPSWRKDMRKKQSSLFSQPGHLPLRQTMTSIGSLGWTSPIQDKRIRQLEMTISSATGWQ